MMWIITVLHRYSRKFSRIFFRWGDTNASVRNEFFLERFDEQHRVGSVARRFVPTPRHVAVDFRRHIGGQRQSKGWFLLSRQQNLHTDFPISTYRSFMPLGRVVWVWPIKVELLYEFSSNWTVWLATRSWTDVIIGRLVHIQAKRVDTEKLQRAKRKYQSPYMRDGIW